MRTWSRSVYDDEGMHSSGSKVPYAIAFGACESPVHGEAYPRAQLSGSFIRA